MSLLSNSSFIKDIQRVTNVFRRRNPSNFSLNPQNIRCGHQLMRAKNSYFNQNFNLVVITMAVLLKILDEEK